MIILTNFYFSIIWVVCVINLVVLFDICGLLPSVIISSIGVPFPEPLGPLLTRGIFGLFSIGRLTHRTKRRVVGLGVVLFSESSRGPPKGAMGVPSIGRLTHRTTFESELLHSLLPVSVKRYFLLMFLILFLFIFCQNHNGFFPWILAQVCNIWESTCLKAIMISDYLVAIKWRLLWFFDLIFKISKYETHIHTNSNTKMLITIFALWGSKLKIIRKTKEFVG